MFIFLFLITVCSASEFNWQGKFQVYRKNGPITAVLFRGKATRINGHDPIRTIQYSSDILYNQDNLRIGHFNITGQRSCTFGNAIVDTTYPYTFAGKLSIVNQTIYTKLTTVLSSAIGNFHSKAILVMYVDDRQCVDSCELWMAVKLIKLTQNIFNRNSDNWSCCDETFSMTSKPQCFYWQ